VLGDDAVFAIDLVGNLHVAAAFCFIGGKIVARGRLDSPSGLHEQRRFAWVSAVLRGAVVGCGPAHFPVGVSESWGLRLFWVAKSKKSGRRPHRRRAIVYRLQQGARRAVQSCPAYRATAGRQSWVRR
jgi:hypothetical protein